MDIRKAVQRLGWRFSEAVKKQDKSFKINQNDIRAIKEIDNYVSKSQAQQFVDQELFAKLYIYLYMKILENDKTTVLDTIPRKKIYNLLKKSIPDLIEEFKNSLNATEFYSLSEELKLSRIKKLSDAECESRNLKHGSYLVEDDSEDLDKLDGILEDENKRAQFLGEVWDYETVAECIEAEVNQAINYHTK